jgi:hypothetical protein
MKQENRFEAASMVEAPAHRDYNSSNRQAAKSGKRSEMLVNTLTKEEISISLASNFFSKEDEAKFVASYEKLRLADEALLANGEETSGFSSPIQPTKEQNKALKVQARVAR